MPNIEDIEDSDVLVIEDSNTTRKTTAQKIVEYIKAHKKITDFFVHQDAVGVANGIALLDSNRKLKAESIPFGDTSTTIYKGSDGKLLERALDTHILDTDNPHKITQQQIGLSNVNNTSDINKPVSIAQQSAIDLAYQNAVEYANQVKSDIMGGIPDATLDTIVELGEALSNSEDALNAIVNTVGTKAPKEELNSHVNNNTIHVNSTDKLHFEEAYDKLHEHKNKSVLDSITITLITAWNDAVAHISDELKHINSTERVNWNDAYNKTHVHNNDQILNNVTEKSINGMKGATQSKDGVMGLVPAPLSGSQLSHYLRADGTWHEPSGVASSVTGVKGNNEVAYRTGNINITPEDIGASTINEIVQNTQPSNQKAGDFWMREY